MSLFLSNFDDFTVWFDGENIDGENIEDNDSNDSCSICGDPLLFKICPIFKFLDRKIKSIKRYVKLHKMKTIHIPLNIGIGEKLLLGENLKLFGEKERVLPGEIAPSWENGDDDIQLFLEFGMGNLSPIGDFPNCLFVFQFLIA